MSPEYQIDGSNRWEAEYAKGGIPSSVRNKPSGSVVEFYRYAISAGISSGIALDLGCGSGRNTLFLASRGFDVIALDFTKSVVESLRLLVLKQGLENLVTALTHDLRTPWPVASGKVAIAIDAFCLKHQIAPEDVASYVREAARVIRSGGLLMVSFAGRADGYYAQFPTATQGGPGLIIIDPGNGIASRLYNIDELADLFAGFHLEYSRTKHDNNEMHGVSFDRETHVIYLRRD
jgi:SAM-dependent methyltransferase